MDIEIELTKQSLTEAIRRLETYKKEIVAKTQRLIETLTESGVAIARAELVSMDAIDTSELYNSVNSYYSALLNAGFIRVNCDYAVFVEFGTGVNNEKYPSGELLSKAGWKYGSGKHIFTTKDGRTGWFYPTGDGEYRFTEGMDSRPFMYNTAQQLGQDFPSLAKAVFR